MNTLNRLLSVFQTKQKGIYHMLLKFVGLTLSLRE